MRNEDWVLLGVLGVVFVGLWVLAIPKPKKPRVVFVMDPAVWEVLSEARSITMEAALCD